MNFRYFYSMRKVLVSNPRGASNDAFLYEENALHFPPSLFPITCSLSFPSLPLATVGVPPKA